MIVFDTSSLVGAAISPDGVPARALVRAADSRLLALSPDLLAELAEVLSRPRLARFLAPGRREDLLAYLIAGGTVELPTTSVQDRRDPKDDKVLEPAPACAARAIVASDADLLVLHPWRGVPILSPADHLLTPA